MKIFITIMLLCILAISLTLTLDESAMQLHNQAFERAMIAFGLAKGLNAVISLIQGTALSFAPIGIGLSFSIGEVLDPFNDMVERFSWVMLAASVSLGIQKILLILSSKIFIQVALSLSIVISLCTIWIQKISSYRPFILSMKIVLLLLVLRFGTIVFIYSSEILYNSVLDTDYKKSSEVLALTKEKLEKIHGQNTSIIDSQQKSAWYELDVSSKYSELKEQLNLSQKLDDLSQSIADASTKVLTLITIFMLQSIIMPLLFLWFFAISIRVIFRMEVDEKKVILILK